MSRQSQDRPVQLQHQIAQVATIPGDHVPMSCGPAGHFGTLPLEDVAFRLLEYTPDPRFHLRELAPLQDQSQHHGLHHTINSVNPAISSEYEQPPVRVSVGHGGQVIQDSFNMENGWITSSHPSQASFDDQARVQSHHPRVYHSLSTPDLSPVNSSPPPTVSTTSSLQSFRGSTSPMSPHNCPSVSGGFYDSHWQSESMSFDAIPPVRPVVKIMISRVSTTKF